MQPVSGLTDSGFVPRREFIRDQRTTSDFSLLAISGSSSIRLYSFSLEVVADLRRLFDHFYLNAAFREDTTQKLCEFQLHGKPWASPKSARTERILLDIIAIIYRHSYTILSTIDYGRERDDRLAISFSRLSTPSLPFPPHSPIPAGSGSNLSHGTGGRHERKTPFAISFISSTVMRVISPPLNSTPAILQAVRGSWPRGVVSEKKVGDAAYEFKFKGYSWFNEDTFATDSLHQILSLLTSLDGHACTMVTSLSICGRSRVKDLWVFIAPGSPDPYDQNWPESPISQSGSMLDVRRSNRASTPEPGHNSDAGVIPASLHRRAATAPQHFLPPSYGPSAPHHIRTTTDTNSFPTFPAPLPLSSSPAVPGIGMRKPAPRAQVPVSVDLDAHDDEHDRYRTSLPSAVPSSCENMTGIGTLNRGRFISKAIEPPEPKCEDEVTIRSPSEQHTNRSRSPSPHHRVSAMRPVSTRSKTPPLLTSHPRDPRTPSPPPSGSLMGMHRAQDMALGENSTLLSPGMFRIRDSAFSSNSVDTTGSCDVPIRWTGLGKPEGIENIEEEPELFTEQPRSHPTLRTPVLPGGWSTTPEEEASAANDSSKTDEDTVRPEHGRHPDRSLHDVDVRVASLRDGTVRKSEAGMIGMIAPRSPPPPVPTPPGDSTGNTKGGSSPPVSPTKTGSRSGSGNGWVLVNVEGKDHANGHSPSPLTSPTIPNQDRARRVSHVNEKAPMSPTAKAIVIIDAKDGKGARVRGGGSGLRRLLSLSRPGKGAEELVNDTRLTHTPAHEPATNGTSQGKELVRSGRFRSKLTRLGASESSSKPPDNGRVRVNLN
ncbi:hypothetical protein L210DRAFT_3758239 [Boletus edulis BED1]|uniref:Uncharacterized protein n=1 Tax=Boletus edulis BED1 TaxID=1328754 RepID=A0AAD4C1K3_BOLED|nr:hypothetical protein L210DRAFT_3758239 [Boletus edulis BED1]